jgi:hypothetical protein
MGTPLIGMTIKEACDIISNYRDLQGLPGYLEALKDMEACYDDLDREDRAAFNMFMRTGQKMFMADE